MIECKNGKCMINGSAGTLLSELATITQALKRAMGDGSEDMISVAVALGVSEVFKGKQITDEEYYQEMS